ncbi:MAG: class I SAM-dependent methyltransferase [Candidatus Rokubacteria bacterium]|nr:class I SAM-dependent methyltransferase [Candidatus Rokubacteria bacterium]
MTATSQTSPSAARIRRHFSEYAGSFDKLYDGKRLKRILRRSLWQRQQVTLDLVRSFEAPSVLDVGCGSGRIAEDILEHGASRYVGIDFSAPMLELARDRLRRFGARVELLEGDYRLIEVDERFDVVVALGLFDYLPDAATVARRMHGHCQGALVATFPRWTWTRGPYRAIRYGLFCDCPIFNYTRAGIESMLGQSGFRRVSFKVANYVLVVVAEPFG